LDEPRPAPAAAVKKAGKSPQPRVAVLAWAGQHDSAEPASSLFTNAPGAAGGRAIAAIAPPKTMLSKRAAGAASGVASAPDMTLGACTLPTASGHAKQAASAMAGRSPIAARATGSKSAASSRTSSVAPGREWRSCADAKAACSKRGAAGAGAAPARSPARRLLDALRWLGGGGKRRDAAMAGMPCDLNVPATPRVIIFAAPMILEHLCVSKHLPCCTACQSDLSQVLGNPHASV